MSILKKGTIEHPLFFLPMRLFKKHIFLLYVAFIAIICIVFIAFCVKPTSRNRSVPEQTIVEKPSPTPLIYPFLCHGSYIFEVSAGDKEQPKLITEGELDPCDPEPGDSQILKITSIPGVENLVVTILTDTKQIEVPFVKDANKINVWQASWTLNDTYHYVYTVIIHKVVRDKKRDVVLTFR